MVLIDATTISNIKSVREKSSLNRRMCIRFESRKICVAGNQCDNNDFDFHNAEHGKHLFPYLKPPSIGLTHI